MASSSRTLTLNPRQFIHVERKKSGMSHFRLETGPKKLILSSEERACCPDPHDFFVIPEGLYFGVSRDTRLDEFKDLITSRWLFNGLGFDHRQIPNSATEYRLHRTHPDPFPLLPGEIYDRHDMYASPYFQCISLASSATAVELTALEDEAEAGRKKGDTWYIFGPLEYYEPKPRIASRYCPPGSVVKLLPGQKLRLRALIDFTDMNDTDRIVGKEFEISFAEETIYPLSRKESYIRIIDDRSSPPSAASHTMASGYDFFSLVSKGQPFGSTELDKVWSLYDTEATGRLSLQASIYLLQDISASMGFTMTAAQAQDVLEDHFQCMGAPQLNKELFKFLFLQIIANPIPSLQTLCINVLSPEQRTSYLSFSAQLTPGSSRLALTDSLAHYGETSKMRPLHEMFEYGVPHLNDEKLVYVQTLPGLRYPIYIRFEDTIETLKEQIAVKMRAETDQIRLILCGKELEDGRTLHDYNTSLGATFHCVLRLRRGGG